jgi:plasmid stabilization system protein ParE
MTAASAFYAIESDERIVVKFFRALDEAFERISAHPESCPLYHRETRRILLNHFPYWVYYRVRGGSVEVFAVLHAKRNPAFLRSKSG